MFNYHHNLTWNIHYSSPSRLVRLPRSFSFSSFWAFLGKEFFRNVLARSCASQYELSYFFCDKSQPKPKLNERKKATTPSGDCREINKEWGVWLETESKNSHQEHSTNCFESRIIFVITVLCWFCVLFSTQHVFLIFFNFHYVFFLFYRIHYDGPLSKTVDLFPFQKNVMTVSTACRFIASALPVFNRFYCLRRSHA